MARRDEVRVSLFPFMSVLACTIGALILLLTSLSVSAVAPPPPERPPVDEAGAEADRLERPDGTALRETAARLESLLARVDGLRVERGGAIGATLAELDAEAARRRARADALEDRVARSARLATDLAALRNRRADLAQDGEQIEAEIAALESRRETLPILIDPSGVSRHLSPWFVECDAGGITAYRVQDGLRHFVPRDELSPSGDYGRYLRRLRATPGALLVLLIRPDGLRTAAVAETVARASGVRVAELPLPGRGELDWSALRRAEASGAADAPVGEARP